MFSGVPSSLIAAKDVGVVDGKHLGTSVLFLIRSLKAKGPMLYSVLLTE